MVGFLNGLGAFAGGLAPGVAQLAQNMNNDSLGKALADIYGGGQAQPQGQQRSGLLGSIGSLFQGGQQGQQPMPAMQQVPQQPVAQMGARMPQPQQQAPPQIVQAPQPVQPPIVQPGAGAPGAQPQQQQIAPQMQAQAPQPQQPQPMPRPDPQAQPQGQQQGTGPLDIPTLVRSLTAHGITGHKLVDALHTAVPLLNAQGLAQYRDLGLQLRREHEGNMEADRQFNRDPNAPGSRAQSRVANQGIAVQRMEGIQRRFEGRMAAAADKLASAKTDKQAVEAKKDLDKIASELKGELASELQIASAPGTSPEEQKAALAKAAEIRQQMEQAVDAAVKTRRSGGANGDQVGGVSGAEKPPESGGQDTAYGPDGRKMKYKGSGDRLDPANWIVDGQ